MPVPEIYLIDGNSLCYRAFFAIQGLSTSYGQPTNAIYGFINMLSKILKERQPRYLAVCFDVSRDTFRRKKFAEYKVNRPSLPPALFSQFGFIKEILDAWGIKVFEAPGYEADDVIATLAQGFSQKGYKAVVVSQDKDILQLVTDKVRIYNPSRKDGLIDKDWIRTMYNLEPSQIKDMLALMGDAVDNIPGIKGIGEKTALRLIQEFGDIQKLLQHLAEVKPEGLRQALSEEREQIRLNSQLIDLDNKVPVPLELEPLQLQTPDYSRLFEIYRRLEFKTLAKDLPIEREPLSFSRLQIKEEAQIHRFKKIVSQKGRLALSVGPNTAGDEGKGEAWLFLAGSEGEVWVMPPSLQQKWVEFLSCPEVLKIGFNLKRTMRELMQRGLKIGGKIFDTQIATYLIDPAKEEYLLNEIAWEYLGMNLQEEGFEPAKEVALSLRLAGPLEKILKERGLENLLYEVEMPLVEVLASMEEKGVALDSGYLKKLSSKFASQLKDLEEKIYTLAGEEFNLNSPKQLAKVLFEKLKLPIVKRTKTGASTNEEVLKVLASRHPMVEHILSYRQLVKLKSTYIDALPALVCPETGRIHPHFHQTGTQTGRLSCSHPNLQNIPVKTEEGKGIRKAVIAGEKDSELLSADYSQIELRILAHLSRDTMLVSAFREGRDIHRFTASLIHNLKEGEVTDAQREMAKRVNFGIIYGMSAFGLAKDLGISAEEARVFIESYFNRYEGVKRYIDHELSQARQAGYVTTLLGRRRYLPQINDSDVNLQQFAQRQAVNAPIQGTAADLIKLAMVRIHEELEKKKMGSRLILQVHDELVFELPRKEEEGLVGIVRTHMEHALSLEVPIKVTIKTGPNWLEMEER